MSETPPNDPVPPPTPSATPTPPSPGPTLDPGVDPADFEKNKIFAILAYLGILVLVPILAAKDSKFARYHANQGLLLLIVSVVIAIGFTIVIVIGNFIAPGLAACAGCIVWLAFLAGLLALTIMGILNAVNGKLKPLPLIGGFTILK